ncbi:hypothetical protein NDU88_005539 [Pleurodeles waltl]|uniref:Uncharacterized protein n=1 Tax=Pleurodeles waltl TaxID=8319 RepID=A0AAV7PIF0_PLEWA|nr:hypothetical protein NDU88_005539 [Pleurodeles waltl]
MAILAPFYRRSFVSGRPGYFSPRLRSGPVSAPTRTSPAGAQLLPVPTPGHLSGRGGSRKKGMRPLTSASSPRSLALGRSPPCRLSRPPVAAGGGPPLPASTPGFSSSVGPLSPTSGLSWRAPLPPGLRVPGALGSSRHRPQAADFQFHPGLLVGPGSGFTAHLEQTVPMSSRQEVPLTGEEDFGWIQGG